MEVIHFHLDPFHQLKESRRDVMSDMRKRIADAEASIAKHQNEIKKIRAELASLLCPFSYGDVVEFDHGSKRVLGKVELVRLNDSGKSWVIQGRMVRRSDHRIGKQTFVCNKSFNPKKTSIKTRR